MNVFVHPNVIFLAGLVIITLGAEMLLRGASRLAALLGIKPLIIGLTIVSIGTSVPELAVGIKAANEGRGSIAIGNIAGTNVINILLILGLSAAMRALPIQLLSIKLDVPVMIASSLALIAMAWDGTLSQTEGAILVLSAVFYTIALIRFSRRESPSIQKEFAEEFGVAAIPKIDPAIPHADAWPIPWSILLFLVGMGLTLFGAELLVSGATSIARVYGISDAVIGLTIVAIGTSAPELATTIIATMKNDRDVAVGNLIGSSTYNILVILGLTCLSSPGGIAVAREILLFDLPLAALTAVACFPIFKSDRMVSRKEGTIFVGAYILYLTSILALRA